MSSRMHSRSRSSRSGSRAQSSSIVPVVIFLLAIPVLGLVGFVAYRYAKNPPKAIAVAERSADAAPPSKKAKKEKKVKHDEDKGLQIAEDYKKGSSSSVRSGSSGFGRGSGPALGPFADGSLSMSRSHADHLSNELATDRVGWEIVDALEVRPTLAIWLFDRTSSAADQRSAVTGRLKEVLKGFDELQSRGHKAFANTSKGPPLLTAVAAYGKTCEILTAEPTDSSAVLASALENISEEKDGVENTFGAIETVLNEFLKYRTEKQRLIVLTVVTDERGDDAAKVDPLALLVEKHGISVFTIGVPSPFGRTGSLSLQATKENGKPVEVGPESLDLEMIDLETRGGSLRGEQLDSGYGPFALSRLAKAAGGSYLIVRNSGGFGGFSSSAPPEAHTLAKYAPDYVSRKEYDALLAENKCRMALHNAAQLEPVEIGAVSLTTSFAKQDESKLKKECDRAQQSVARIEPKLRPLYAALSPGESDRPKLTGARWQAAYDVSMGRVLAARARYEGYNSMVAQLKQGKRPGGPDDTVWIMNPAGSFSTDSSIDKLVKQAHKYLQRVVDEHPGTIWEKMAQQELGAECGWEWSASK